MGARHTQGSWSVDGKFDLLDVISPSGRIAMLDCENDDIFAADIEANARLIAAAPDLLAALEDALEALVEVRYYPAAISRLRQTIAKATGA